MEFSRNCQSVFGALRESGVRLSRARTCVTPISRFSPRFTTAVGAVIVKSSLSLPLLGRNHPVLRVKFYLLSVL